MHINSDTTFGHSGVQNNEAKESNSHLYTFSKKEHNDDSKDGVRMIETREDYYNSRDTKSLTAITLIIGWQTFLTVSHQQLALAVNKKA
jgi:hypothetical protein